MLAEKYLQRRYREGREAERAAWMAWYERWQAAQSRGEPFDEPPPNRQEPDS